MRATIGGKGPPSLCTGQRLTPGHPMRHVQKSRDSAPRGPGALSWALLCQQRHTWQLPLPHMSPAPQCAALSTFWEVKGLWTEPPGVLTTSQVGTPGRGCGRGWSDRRRGASPWEITILPAHGCLPNSRADGQLSPAAEGPAGREGQCGSGHSLAWPQESGAPTPADPALPLEQNKPVAESQAPQLEELTLLGSSCSGGPSALQPPIHPLRPGPPTPGQGTVGQQVATPTTLAPTPEQPAAPRPSSRLRLRGLGRAGPGVALPAPSEARCPRLVQGPDAALPAQVAAHKALGRVQRAPGPQSQRRFQSGARSPWMSSWVHAQGWFPPRRGTVPDLQPRKPRCHVTTEPGLPVRGARIQTTAQTHTHSGDTSPCSEAPPLAHAVGHSCTHTQDTQVHRDTHHSHSHTWTDVPAHA